MRYLKNGAAKAIRTLRADRRRRSPHRSGGRVVPATDSAPLHRGRPRRRHRGARDGAQWPGRARVRTDGARRVHHGSHAGRQLENRPHGRALLGRRDRRTRRRGQVSVGGCGRGNRATAWANPLVEWARTATSYCSIAQAQTALDQLQAQTWGVWLHEDAAATRYVVLPMGTLEVEGWPWTVQGQPAVLLSSE